MIFSTNWKHSTSFSGDNIKGKRREEKGNKNSQSLPDPIYLKTKQNKHTLILGT